MNEVMVEKAPVSQADTNELLMQMMAASINPLDVRLVSGNVHGYFPLILPFIVGIDLFGIVIKVEAPVRTPIMENFA